VILAKRLNSISVSGSEVVDPVFFLAEKFSRQFGKITAQIKIVVIITVCIKAVANVSNMPGNKPLVSAVENFIFSQ